MIIKPGDKKRSGYYANQYHYPRHKYADELGYIHFETASELETFVKSRGSLVDSKAERIITIFTCFLFIFMFVGFVIGVILYVVF